jgi:hypothetical protein
MAIRKKEKERKEEEAAVKANYNRSRSLSLRVIKIAVDQMCSAFVGMLTFLLFVVTGGGVHRSSTGLGRGCS